MFTIEMNPGAVQICGLPLRYGFELLPVPEGWVNAFPVAIPAPDIVIGTISRHVHHALYEQRPVIWRDGVPQHVEWPDIRPSPFVNKFYPPYSLVTAAAAAKVPTDQTGAPSGFIAGSLSVFVQTAVEFAKKGRRSRKRFRKDDDSGFQSSGVLWDLNGRIIQVVQLPQSMLNDVNAAGVAVGRSTDYCGIKRAIKLKPRSEGDGAQISFLDQELYKPGSWTIEDALAIDDGGMILAIGAPRWQRGQRHWLLLIQGETGYIPIPAEACGVESSIIDASSGAAKFEQKIGLFRRMGKIGIRLGRETQVEFSVKRINAGLSFSIKRKRVFGKIRRPPQLTIKAVPRRELSEPVPAALFGCSDDAIVLGLCADLKRHGISSILVLPNLQAEVVPACCLFPHLSGIYPDDPLVIGNNGDLSGQCRVDGVINAYLLRRFAGNPP